MHLLYANFPVTPPWYPAVAELLLARQCLLVLAVDRLCSK
jgi:hypothetical protein